MRINAGQVAMGKDFFERPRELNRLLRALDAGEHVLLSAPRRTGKTSLLKHLEGLSNQNCQYLYLLTQSVQTESEFFEKVQGALLETEEKEKLRSAVQKTGSFLGRVKSVKAFGFGVEFRQANAPNAFERLLVWLRQRDANALRLVLMIDEFPDVLTNIRDEDGDTAAVQFLQHNRELRQNGASNVQFVYTGSIGLENVAGQMNRSQLISDLESIHLSPLTKEEARAMVQRLCDGLDFNLTTHVLEFALQRIEWLIPFHIQLLLKEIRDLCERGMETEVDQEQVNRAYREMLRREKSFKHWLERLKNSFRRDDFKFAVALLNEASEDGTIPSQKIHDLAVKHGVEDGYREVRSSLEHDGYISNDEDPRVYRFNSPILREWWYRNVAN